MKLLVATRDLQGIRPNDFCWTEEGEIVHLGFQCSREEVDGGCGCRRSFTGLKTQKGTTTAKVAEVDVTVEELRRQFRASYDGAGWTGVTDEEIANEVEWLIRLAENWGVPWVVERREVIQQRPLEWCAFCNMEVLDENGSYQSHAKRCRANI